MKTLTDYLTEVGSEVNWKEEFEKVLAAFQNALSGDDMVKSVSGKYTSFCPYLNYIRVDFLDQKDWPNNISQNSIYIDFSVNLQEKKIEVNTCGHIWLTDADQKASYMAMASLKNYTKVYSSEVSKVTWMRPVKIKTYEDAASKVAKFIKSEGEVITWAAGEYPYKKAQVNIYC